MTTTPTPRRSRAIDWSVAATVLLPIAAWYILRADPTPAAPPAAPEPVAAPAAAAAAAAEAERAELLARVAALEAQAFDRPASAPPARRAPAAAAVAGPAPVVAAPRWGTTDLDRAIQAFTPATPNPFINPTGDRP